MSAPWGESPVFLLQNWLDADGVTVAVTSNDDDPDYPASNLLEDDVSQLVHWTNDDDAERITTFDLGAARAVDVIALVLCNYTEDATHVFERSSDGSAWTPIDGDAGGIVDERPNAAENRKLLVFLTDATQTYRYFRHKVTDTSNPDGRLGAARALIGPAFQAGIAQAWGHKVRVAPADTVQRTPGGVQHRRASGRPHVVELEYEWLTDTEANEDLLEGLDAALGLAGGFVVVLDPSTPANWWRNAFYVFCPDPNDGASPPGYGQWTWSKTLEEILP